MKKYHIISRDRGWAIKKEGSSRAIKIFKDKSDAIRYYIEVIREEFVLYVHKEDGSIDTVL